MFTWKNLSVIALITTLVLFAPVLESRGKRVCVAARLRRVITELPLRHPSTCKYLDCPSYTVLSRYDDAELRRYDSATWATTHVEHKRYDWAVPSAFRRLLGYFRGGNEDRIKMAMTAPVVVKASLGVVGLKREILEGFYLPRKYQMSPPAPTCPDVNITCTSNHTTVFSRSFGGYATGPVVEFLARDFIRNLRDANLTSGNITHFVVAIYDPPFKVIGRYNEIWVPASNSSTTASMMDAVECDRKHAPPV